MQNIHFFRASLSYFTILTFRGLQQTISLTLIYIIDHWSAIVKRKKQKRSESTWNIECLPSP